MPSPRTLNATNLEALGAARLAALLMEVSTGNAVAQRRLRLALAGSAGPAEAARAVAKRLGSIGRATTWLDWRKIKPLVVELEAQRRAIAALVAPAEPREAFELAWQLVGCAESVLKRSDDIGGQLAQFFGAAARDLGPLAERAAVPPGELAARASRALANDGPDAWDELVPILAPHLAAEGLAGLREAMRAWQEAAGVRAHRAGPVLRQVADAMGDVDGYIAQHGDDARAAPQIAAGIARRLLGAGRAEEAWAALERVPAARRGAGPDWDEARVATLEALGRGAEAREFRWRRFAATLSPAHLRAFLKGLPDFADVEAEQEAFALARAFPDVHAALGFFLAWPDLREAAGLVLARAGALNGDHYEILSPAAEALDARHPLAATVLRRAMIDFALRHARSARYKHAARHLVECRAAALRVADWGGVAEHAGYEGGLRAAHGRKAGFWALAEGETRPGRAG